jgi:hypothetical protein
MDLGVGKFNGKCATMGLKFSDLIFERYISG